MPARLQAAERFALHYESKLKQRDEPVIEKMRELSALYPRWGYRRMRVMLARDGITMSVNRPYRLWKKADQGLAGRMAKTAGRGVQALADETERWTVRADRSRTLLMTNVRKYGNSG